VFCTLVFRSGQKNGVHVPAKFRMILSLVKTGAFENQDKIYKYEELNIIS
jgi:hypothetical protein